MPHFDRLSDDTLDILLALEDEDFLSTLASFFYGRHHDETNYSLLYRPRVVARLALAYANSPETWEGSFAPVLRKHRPQFDYRTFITHVKAVGAATTPYVRHPVLVCLADVQPETVPWLWYPYISFGTLTLLDGDPGAGKSQLTLKLAATLSQGQALPDSYGQMTIPTVAAPSVFLALQDSLANTMRPRLDALGANVHLVHSLRGWNDPVDETDIRPITLTDLDILENVLTTVRPKLVVVDPIQAYMGAKVDMYRANETNVVLSGLRKLAERHQCAIVCVRHVRKGREGKAQHQGIGSTDFSGEARSVLLLEQSPIDRREALLGHAKTNQGPLGRTQVFRKHQGVQWAGVTRMDAEVLAASARASELFEAFRWLEKRLEDSPPVPSKDIEMQAEQEDIAKATLIRAKKLLGVKSSRTSDAWFMRLPSLEPLEDAALFTPSHTPPQLSHNETPYVSNRENHSDKMSPRVNIGGSDIYVTSDTLNTKIENVGRDIHIERDAHDERDEIVKPSQILMDGETLHEENEVPAQMRKRISSFSTIPIGAILGGDDSLNDRFPPIMTDDSQNESLPPPITCPSVPCEQCGGSKWQTSVTPPRCLSCGHRSL